LSHLDLPLIGLLEDVILPGEERSFAAPQVDTATLAALHGRKLSRLCAITIASPVELPSLVSLRWGTECSVLSATSDAILLRGERRVRVDRASGKDSPFTAQVSLSGDNPSGLDTRALISAAHALLAALDAGAVPEPPEWQERLPPAILSLARALSTEGELRDILLHAPADGLRRLASALAARAPGHHASCELEAMMRELARKPELSKPLKHRLWSQVVEIQKRLDVYDPAEPEEGDDIARLQRRLMQAGLPKIARETAKRELRLLRGMSTNHHDYSTYLGHLDLMARLPWHPDPSREGASPALAIQAVAEALDREHAGLDKAKRRVLELLAVRALGGESASMILCLSGPPGVGKTSIARVIAEALGRPFVRIPLGGVHDESELRGHRPSFTAASAGRLLRGLAQAGSASAVALLDEIDKIGTDRQRSPMGALLEALDPEQNHSFQDNYLGVPFDLSHVLWIATANDPSLIHPTLRDRMEPVELEGYTAKEKAVIARDHLLERLRKEIGLKEAPVIEEDALTLLIEGYTREAGVRQLRRSLSAIFRARALELVRSGAEEAGARPQAPISEAEVRAVLGPPRHRVKVLRDALPAGVAVGLSVSADGGSILFIEVGLMPGRGRLKLTGQLGDVFRESAHTASAHLRIAPERYRVAASRLKRDIHVHVPEAATAKDGPSAGAAIFAALVSAATGVPLPGETAITGEISLSGHVLPVGGVRAKLLAAERAGVRRAILPEDNLADVPPDLAIEVVAVRSLDEVCRLLFPAALAASGVMPADLPGSSEGAVSSAAPEERR
jgi:ATP-dependent Lon protease